MKKILFLSLCIVAAFAAFTSCGEEEPLPITVQSVEISPSGDFKLIVGETKALTASVKPADAADKTIAWSSSDTAVASIDAKGTVSALAPGKATLIAKSTNGKTDTASVSVAAKVIPLESIELPKEVAEELKGGLTLEIDSTKQIPLVYIPADATDKTVTWASKDEKVATVSSDGTITAVAAGTTEITATIATIATTKAAATSITIVVTVKAPTVAVTGVSLNKTTASLEVGESAALSATIAPANATNKAVTWKSSNTAVATVDTTGKVTGVAAGTATITVTTKDGSKTATCTVTVKHIADGFTTDIDGWETTDGGEHGATEE